MGLPQITPYELPESTVPVRAQWRLEPERTALLVHDMQEYFLRPFPVDMPPLRPARNAIDSLRHAARSRGIPVVFSVQPGEQSDEERGLLREMWGQGIVQHPELTGVALHRPPEVEDLVIQKRRYSAFFNTDLHERLAALGRDQLLITGVYAHIGCQLTAADAFMRGIQPFFVADAVADFTREDHEVALRQVARTCGVVCWTEEVITWLS